MFTLQIKYLFVRLLGTGGDRVGLAQSGERPRPQVRERRWDDGGDGLFRHCSITIAVGTQRPQGTGRWRVGGRWVLAQSLLWNTEEVHSEEDAPGQRCEEVDDLVLGAEQLPHHGMTPVHGAHQVTKGPAQAWKAQRQRLNADRKSQLLQRENMPSDPVTPLSSSIQYLMKATEELNGTQPRGYMVCDGMLSRITILLWWYLSLKVYLAVFVEFFLCSWGWFHATSFATVTAVDETITSTGACAFKHFICFQGRMTWILSCGFCHK